MNEKISRVSLIVFVVLLIATGFLLSVPGGRVPVFCIMGMFAVPPLIAGPKLYRLLGIVALLIAIVSAVSDYRNGKGFREKWERMSPNMMSNMSEKEANHGLESTSAPPAAGTLETHP